MFPSQINQVEKVKNKIKNSNFYCYDFSLKEQNRDVLFVNKKFVNIVENIILTILSSKLCKKIVKKRRGLMKYSLELEGDISTSL